MTPEQIRAIRERCERATPGHWRSRKSVHRYVEIAFIAHAREDIPALLAERDDLLVRIADAEVALATWDESRTSEYWLRHQDALLSRTTEVKP